MKLHSLSIIAILALSFTSGQVLAQDSADPIARANIWLDLGRVENDKRADEYVKQNNLLLIARSALDYYLAMPEDYAVPHSGYPGIYSAWTIREGVGPQAAWQSALSKELFNCTKRESASIYLVVYPENERMGKGESSQRKPEFSPVIPRSVGAGILNAVCKAAKHE